METQLNRWRGYCAQASAGGRPPVISLGKFSVTLGRRFRWRRTRYVEAAQPQSRPIEPFTGRIIVTPAACSKVELDGTEEAISTVGYFCRPRCATYPSASSQHARDVRVICWQSGHTPLV